MHSGSLRSEPLPADLTSKLAVSSLPSRALPKKQFSPNDDHWLLLWQKRALEKIEINKMPQWREIS
jgi:hypothetical protein